MIPTLAAPGARPGARRTARHPRQLALDLPSSTCPIGIVGVRLRLQVPARAPRADRRPLRRRRASCSRAAALALIVYALSEGPTRRLDVAAGADHRRDSALVAVGRDGVRRDHASRTRCWSCGCSATGCSASATSSACSRSASFLGLTFVMPLYLQLLRGQDALSSGLTTFPQAFGHHGLVAGRRPAVRAHRPAPADVGRAVRRRPRRSSRFTTLGLRHRPVGDPSADVRSAACAWASRSCRCRRPSYATIEPRRQRAGLVDLLHAAPDRRVARCRDPGQHPHLVHADRRLADHRSPERALTGFHWAFGVAVLFSFLAALSPRSSSATARPPARCGCAQVAAHLTRRSPGSSSPLAVGVVAQPLLAVERSARRRRPRARRTARTGSGRSTRGSSATARACAARAGTCRRRRRVRATCGATGSVVKHRLSWMCHCISAPPRSGTSVERDRLGSMYIADTSCLRAVGLAARRPGSPGGPGRGPRRR